MRSGVPRTLTPAKAATYRGRAGGTLPPNRPARKGNDATERRCARRAALLAGMDVHDVGDYGAALQPGMVLTVEPGVYLPGGSPGAGIETDVLVTATGHEVLSSGAPRSAAEVEKLMHGAQESRADARSCRARPLHAGHA